MHSAVLQHSVRYGFRVSAEQTRVLAGGAACLLCVRRVHRSHLLYPSSSDVAVAKQLADVVEERKDKIYVDVFPAWRQ